MARLYVTEYAIGSLIQVGGSLMQAPHEPPLAEQVLPISTTVQSLPFNKQTTLVRLHCDAVCSVVFGTNPTATANSQRMAASQTEFKSIPKGQSYMVSVIANA